MEKSLQIRCEKLEDLPTAAAKIVAFAGERDLVVWTFEGEMGAGKTTLIKAICRLLGVEDTVQSPTFSIVNEYRTPAGEPVYHFDFYRLKDAEEAVHIGAEEYFYSANLCLIEWPSKIAPLLPDSFLRISLEADKDLSRNILLSIHE